MDQQSNPLQIRQSNINPQPICQSIANPAIRGQYFTNLPIRQSMAKPLILEQFTYTLEQPAHSMPFHSNPMPIFDQFANSRTTSVLKMSTQHQPIRQSFKIRRCNAKPVPICQSIANPPIQCQHETNLPIHRQYPKLSPIFQSRANPGPILCKSPANLPIHYQSANAMSIRQSLPKSSAQL